MQRWCRLLPSVAWRKWNLTVSALFIDLLRKWQLFGSSLISSTQRSVFCLTGHSSLEPLKYSVSHRQLVWTAMLYSLWFHLYIGVSKWAVCSGPMWHISIVSVAYWFVSLKQTNFKHNVCFKVKTSWEAWEGYLEVTFVPCIQEYVKYILCLFTMQEQSFLSSIISNTKSQK